MAEQTFNLDFLNTGNNSAGSKLRAKATNGFLNSDSYYGADFQIPSSQVGTGVSAYPSRQTNFSNNGFMKTYQPQGGVYDVINYDLINNNNVPDSLAANLGTTGGATTPKVDAAVDYRAGLDQFFKDNPDYFKDKTNTTDPNKWSSKDMFGGGIALGQMGLAAASYFDNRQNNKLVRAQIRENLDTVRRQKANEDAISAASERVFGKGV